MEGSEAAEAAGGAGGPGSGEARTNEQASASGGGGAQSGGAGEGRAFETPEPLAPAGSAGVAQAAETASEPSGEDFLDAALEVRDYPTAEVAATTGDASPLIGTEPDATAAPRGAEGVSDQEPEVASHDEVAAPQAIDADASTDRPDGSIEASKASPSSASGRSESSAATDPTPSVPPAPSTAGGSNGEADGAASGGDPAGRDSEESASNEAGRAGDAGSSGGLASDLADSGGDPSSADETSPGSRGRSRILIDLPQIDVEPIEARSLRERSEAAIPDDPRWVLRGAWEQTNRRMNEPDFAPGGYERNLIAIDPEEGVLRTYRVFGGGAYVAAGEYRVEIRPEGTLDLRPDPRRPHLFASEPFAIAGDTVLPPSEPIERPRSWSLRDGVLEIEGRRFVRIERSDFEAVARGDERASDGVLAGGDWSIAPARRDDLDATPAVDFFGTSIVGRHICFVVDVSGSMAGPRLEAALAELARSIESLPQDRFFYVLFFSGSKLVLEDRWLRASPSSKRSFLSKLAGIEAQGGTEPASSLDHAFTSLAPVPDEIHFMTDGLIPQDIPERLRALNGGRVRTVIHTYAFGERASETMLEAIASEHGGRYRFVPE